MDLNRFVTAQQHDYERALAEITSGRKRSHWMWYIFPQMDGLGYSEMSHRYGIKGLGEAKAYLNHPVLGKRLIEICNALLALPGNNATMIMGSPDDMKLRSSMTLFSLVDSADPIFQQVLDKFFNGAKDQATLRLIDA